MQQQRCVLFWGFFIFSNKIINASLSSSLLLCVCVCVCVVETQVEKGMVLLEDEEIN